VPAVGASLAVGNPAPDVRLRPTTTQKGMSRSRAQDSQDRIAIERWFDEGGYAGRDALIERGRASGARRPMRTTASPRTSTRRATVARVVIAGAGVAGLETLLALRALVGNRAEITVVAPNAKFVNRSMAVAQPFSPRRVRGIRLGPALASLGAHWHRGTVDRVEHARRVVVTRDRDELPYDYLVLALGARPDGPWYADRMLTYRDGRDAAAYRLLLSSLRRRSVRRLAFVKPAGRTWPLPLYGLALMTAADSVREQAPIDISFVTPEEEPLAIFGARAAGAVRALLEERGIELYTGSYGVPGRPGWLNIAPGTRTLAADAIVTLPRLVGPRLRGVPCTANGFLRTDAQGRVRGCDGVFAAGDATAFPIKQGGVAAQQADAVAASIAAALGIDVDPGPFEPVLHGLLLTGDRPRYLRSGTSGRSGDESTISLEPLWWPPNKLCARYLAPYLSSQVGEASDVMPCHEDAPAGEASSTPVVGAEAGFGELVDLPPRPAR
jgi:sulfide:quinone oxidoreductase